MKNPICGKSKAQLEREGHTEKTTQRYALDKLTLLEGTGALWFMRTNSFSGTIVRNNGSGGYINNSKKGAPDIVFVFRGQFVGVEVKSPTGHVSEEQELTHSLIMRAGGTVWVIYCPEDLDCYLALLEGKVV